MNLFHTHEHTVGAGDDDMLDRMEGELEEGEQNAQNYYRY
jgi:hypothetical protein